jgi:hypothetical protein
MKVDDQCTPEISIGYPQSFDFLRFVNLPVKAWCRSYQTLGRELLHRIANAAE